MIRSKTVETEWNPKTKDWYISKGYTFTKIRDKFIVDVKDLKEGSNIEIKVVCDKCGKEYLQKYNQYNIGIKNNNGTFRCRSCYDKNRVRTTKIENSIYENNKWMLDYIINEKDARTLSFGSNKKIKMRCPVCGYEKFMSPNRLNFKGFCCNGCVGDGVSYPEKFITNLLKTLKVEYIRELSKKDFDWCSKYRYDFYLPKYNCIIETHGSQHYEANKKMFRVSIEENLLNDESKMKLAISNGVNNYIVLDCRESTFSHMKNSILNSNIIKLLDINIDEIDWIYCETNSRKSDYNEIIQMLKKGIKTKDVAKKFDRTVSCICKYRRKYEDATGEIIKKGIK